MKRSIIPVIALLFLVACGKKEKRTDAALTETNGPAQEEALPVHEDPGAQLQRKTGLIKPVVRPAQTAQVDRVQKGDGHVLAVVPLSGDAMLFNPGAASYAVDAGAIHGAAFGWNGTKLGENSGSAAGLIVRFRAAELPAQFTIRWHERDSLAYGSNRRPGALGELRVTTPAKIAAVKGLDAAFWNAAANAFGNKSGRSAAGFYGFARGRAMFLAGGKKDDPNSFNGRRGGTDYYEMMELYSGMTSVNEALQSDRGLRVRGGDIKSRSVPIGDVKPLQLAAHPWPRMLAELGKQPKIEPLASYVPADMAYLHFDDLRTFVRLVRDLDGWVSPVAQWLEERGGASHFTSRYEEQLILERTGLAEKLGHVAASGVALVTSDPYLREGTDVSMIFKVESKAALVGALGAFETSSRERHPDMQRSSSKVGSVAVQRLFTPDGSVNQYRAEYGEVLVVSNSIGAIEQLLAAHGGKVPKLADQGDFKYLRAIYPWDTKAEDGFLFLSDAFVARAVSPQVKILEARRVEARADVMAVNYAALLRGWVDGERTGSAQELVDAGYVHADELQHPSGEPITLTKQRGAHSAWGDAGRLTPIRDLKVTSISLQEMEAYDRFRDTYESYWRAYLDPIAARINRSEDGKRMRFDARMLPLIDASEYDRLIREVGRQTVLPPKSAPGLQWTFAIGKDAAIRRELDGMARGVIPGDNIGIGWLGDWVSVGVADRSGLWDMALRTRMIPSLAEQDSNMWAFLQHLRTFPIYAQVHVGSKVGLGALLTALKAWTQDAAPGMIAWGQSEPYREIPIVSVGEGEQSDELGGVSLHYATVGDVFVIAFDRPTLLTQIDRIMAGGAAESPTGPPSATADADAQAALNVEFGSSDWLAKTVMGVAEQAMLSDHALVMDGFEVLWRGMGAKDLTADERRELGVQYIGFEPRSPHGGEFSIVDGFPTHSIYGDVVRPNMPAVPIAGSPVSAVIDQLRRISFSVEFEGEGDHRGLHSTAGWDWE